MASVHVLYGPVIYEAIATGDLRKMKSVVKEAETHIKSHGDVSSALEQLKIEIKKVEAKKK